MIILLSQYNLYIIIINNFWPKISYYSHIMDNYRIIQIVIIILLIQIIINWVNILNQIYLNTKMNIKGNCLNYLSI
jgi:hypothetical protein